MTQSPTRRTGEYGPTAGLMPAPLGSPDGATSRSGARTAPRGWASGGTALGDPGRGQRGDEDGVGPVHGPPVLVVQPDRDLGHVAGGEDAEGADGQVDRHAVVVDRDALAPHQPERLVHRAERVRAQGHRAEHFARPDLDLHRPRGDSAEVDARRGPDRRRARATSASPRPTGPGAPPARGAPPGPRPSPRRGGRGRPGGPPRSTSSTSTPGQTAAHGGSERAEVGRTPGAADAHDAGAVGAQGHGERRTLGSTAHHVLAAPQHADRLRPSRRPAPGPAPGTGLRRLPPKAPPLASGEAGVPPGRLQLASGST